MEIYKHNPSDSGNAVRFFDEKIPAGFPSPAFDYMEKKLDLNEYLIEHPDSTYIVRVCGESMKDAGIHDDDLLIIDRSITASLGQIVIAEINGEFTVKKVERINGKLFLTGMNESFSPICINEESEFMVWGVVVYSIHKIS